MHRFVLTLVLAFLTACKIEIKVPEGGDVSTQSGAHACNAGETCVIDVVDLFFDETFEAKPASGYKFLQWRSKTRGFCGGKLAPCRLYTSVFQGTPLSQLLESDEVFYLTPVFGRPGQWQAVAEMNTPRAEFSG